MVTAGEDEDEEDEDGDGEGEAQLQEKSLNGSEKKRANYCSVL
jgi:hypothetical protein